MDPHDDTFNKKVIRDGIGHQSPLPGDMVIFRRTFKKSEGELMIVCATEDHDGVGTFWQIMNGNEMPNGLFKALLEMRRSEISWFEVNLADRFGEPDAYLCGGIKCEIEIIDFFSNPEDLRSDLKIVKSTIREEECVARVTEKYDTVQIRWSAYKLNGEILFEKREEKYICLEDSELFKGLKIGLCAMKRGETALLYVHRDYLTMPSMEEVQYDIDVKFPVEMIDCYTPKQKQKAASTEEAQNVGTFSPFKPKRKQTATSTEEAQNIVPKLTPGEVLLTYIAIFWFITKHFPPSKSKKGVILRKKCRVKIKKKSQMEKARKEEAEMNDSFLRRLFRSISVPGFPTQTSARNRIPSFDLGLPVTRSLDASHAPQNGIPVPIWKKMQNFMGNCWDKIKITTANYWENMKRVIRNNVFMKGVQFFTFGCVILGDKLLAVDRLKHPVKYWILAYSGFFSIFLGFLLVLMFLLVDEISEDLRAVIVYVLPFVEIWIGALGYLA